MTVRAEKKGLVLHHQLAPGSPELVRADPGRIRQVLTNLCDNAIKFTQQGSVNVHIEGTPLSGGGFEIHFAVKDTGIGIPPEKQQGVFGAFNQADTSTTREFGGTGLGLTICARLVELMGGRIWVESEPGDGSTFHFTVRTQAITQAAKPTKLHAMALEQASPGSQEARNNLQILLVDDQPINQLLAKTLLTKWGHSVVAANNGQEAVDLAMSRSWDLVLMDMQMPVMGGVQATQLIRAREPAGQRIPIIAMTANAMESDRLACLTAGMDGHLAKPFNSATLQALVESVARGEFSGSSLSD
jgi:CheY-like chemotaxis protein/anti-sigma regulatory factor (Ser/Thr protein kinase)